MTTPCSSGRSSLAITHVMEPVLPGCFAVLTAAGASETTRVWAARVGDDVHGDETVRLVEWPVAQRRGECLTVDVPPGDYGIYAIYIGETRPDMSRPWFANRPRLDWATPLPAAPGGVLCVVGRCLVDVRDYPTIDPQKPVSYGGLLPGADRVRVVMRPVRSGSAASKGDAPRVVELPVHVASAYELRINLPHDLAPGEYELTAHNTLGGERGWSNALSITVEAAQSWPDKVIELDRYIAELVAKGHNREQAVDEAFTRALAELAAGGGGVLQLADNVYPITQMIVMPPRTVLRGMGMNRTLLTLPRSNGPTGAPVMITGDRDFVIEDLRIMSVYAIKTIVAPTWRPRDFAEAHRMPFSWSDTRARNIVIRRCHIEQRPCHNLPRRIDTPEHLAWLRKWLSSADGQDHSGIVAVQLRGDGLVIEDTTIWGGGSCVVLNGCSHARLSHNDLRVGVGGHGFYAIGKLTWPADFATNPDSGGAVIRGNYSSQILFENNRVTGYSDRARDLVYFIYGCEDCHAARNHVGDIQVNNDCEGLAFHLWSAKWPSTKLRMTGPTQGVISDSQGEVARECLEGAAVEILDGRGVGQSRTVVRQEGDRIEIDRPWHADPDETSLVCYTAPPPFRRMTLVDNVTWCTGANLMLWGNSHDVVLDGNTSRGHQISIWSVRLEGNQKVWGGAAFTQVLHSTLEMGWVAPDDAQEALDLFKHPGLICNPCCLADDGTTIGYDILGLVIRHNAVRQNSGIIFRRTFPYRMAAESGRDWIINEGGVVIEGNDIRDSRIGVVIERGSGAVERHNTAHNVRWPLIWSEAHSSTHAVFDDPSPA
ncbi:MAG: hypothetical protein IT444_08020 [Phycisphaeraceae bacterium]|nr:hypothetical protein [Phycisphaeraceae bacterium]